MYGYCFLFFFVLWTCTELTIDRFHGGPRLRAFWNPLHRLACPSLQSSVQGCPGNVAPALGENTGEDSRPRRTSLRWASRSPRYGISFLPRLWSTSFTYRVTTVKLKARGHPRAIPFQEFPSKKSGVLERLAASGEGLVVGRKSLIAADVRLCPARPPISHLGNRIEHGAQALSPRVACYVVL